MKSDEGQLSLAHNGVRQTYGWELNSFLITIKKMESKFCGFQKLVKQNVLAFTEQEVIAIICDMAIFRRQGSFAQLHPTKVPLILALGLVFFFCFSKPWKRDQQLTSC